MKGGIRIMNDAQNRPLEDLLASGKTFERLSNKIAKGNVFRVMLTEDERGSSGFLFLFPNSEILKHKHYNDWEEYTFPDGRVEKCAIGQSHQLKNQTGELLVVHFAKHRLL